MRSFLLIVTVGLLAMMLAGRLLEPVVESTFAPTIEHLQPLASLITTKVHVNDVVTASIVGQTGDLRAAIIVHGDAMISVDLTKARIEKVDLEARTAVVVLPPPHVVGARVDHNRSHIFDIQTSGLWSLIPTDGGRAELIDQAMRLAQDSVRYAVSDQAIIKQARTRAALLICTFLADSLGWSVEVRWLDRFGKSVNKDARPRLPSRQPGPEGGFSLAISLSKKVEHDNIKESRVVGCQRAWQTAGPLQVYKVGATTW